MKAHNPALPPQPAGVVNHPRCRLSPCSNPASAPATVKLPRMDATFAAAAVAGGSRRGRWPGTTPRISRDGKLDYGRRLRVVNRSQMEMSGTSMWFPPPSPSAHPKRSLPHADECSPVGRERGQLGVATDAHEEPAEQPCMFACCVICDDGYMSNERIPAAPVPPLSRPVPPRTHQSLPPRARDRPPAGRRSPRAEQWWPRRRGR